MPSLARRLAVTLVWTTPLLALAWWLVRQPFPDTEAMSVVLLAVGLEGLVLLAFLLYWGVSARLLGARRAGSRRLQRAGLALLAMNFLGRLSAICLAIGLVYIALLFLPPLAYALTASAGAGAGTDLDASDPSGWSGPNGLPSLALRSVAGFLLFLAGTTIARLLLRVVPPRPDAAVRWGALAGAASLAGWFLLQGWPLGFEVGRMMLFVALGILVPVFWRQLQPEAFLDSPYLLYLRHFSSFSDRAITSTVLGSRPRETQVVMLTPTHSQAGDWNPWRIALAGMRVLSPLRSIPVYLRATDADWQVSARRYMQNASRVVIDVSEDTDAIRTEIDMLSAMDRWDGPSTLILARSGTRSAWADRQGLVRYTKNWWWAIPGILGGSVFALLGLGIFATGLPVLGRIASTLPAGLPLVLLLAVAVPFGLVIISTPLFFFSTFIRPGLDHASTKAIKAWARSGERRRTSIDAGRRRLAWFALGGLTVVMAWSLLEYRAVALLEFVAYDGELVLKALLVAVSAVAVTTDRPRVLRTAAVGLLCLLVTVMPVFMRWNPGAPAMIEWFWSEAASLWFFQIACCLGLTTAAKGRGRLGS